MIPAYLSADGGEAAYVGTLDGREVWAVRRRYGYRKPAVHADMVETHYWTAVVQTMPGKEKSMALFSARFSEARYPEGSPFIATETASARANCINAIVALLAREREYTSRDA